MTPDAAAAPAWHAVAAGEAVRLLRTDAERGLSDEEARSRPRPERLEEAPTWRVAAALFGRQWRETVILILCAASGVFWALGHRNDALGIGFSVVFAVVLGFAMDFRSQRALAALKSLNAPSASVVRDGIMVEIPTSSVVVGDLVSLRAGAFVPADGRIVQAGELTLDESALTGESSPAAKSPDVVPVDAPLAERRNMAYAGATAVTGSGRLLVTAVGLDTELGRIGRLVAAYEKEETPLEVQIAALGRRLTALVVALSAATTALGLLLGQSGWEMLETGFLLAIAAIPEGLPAVNTIALAGGVRRMVRARSIVRKLSAVEVLGSVDVICTDKTGTLTENVMRAAVVCLPKRRLEVTGSGYAPEGRFHEGTSPVEPRDADDLLALLRIGALCNDARLESHEGWHIHGSPTEGALLTVAAQAGIDLEAERAAAARLREIPFTSSRKKMAVVVRDEAGEITALAKGAVGFLLAECDRIRIDGGVAPLTPAARAEIRREAERLGAQGLRVLGLASRRLSSLEDDPERGLVWAGMVGLIDPPRRSAAQAVAALARAGIRTIMVTGDQHDTAAAIAGRLGMRGDDVLARVAPEDKLRLVERLKKEGHVVAMTGDGINDAPALKAADIGVAMGSGAADVAKEAADLVITDAEYATLTAAVEEGRRIYANLRRAARYLLLCSLANIGLMVGGVALRLPLPMTALQLLWLNLVIHIFPAVALAVAPNPRAFLEEPPRRRGAELLGWGEIREIGARSATIFAAALAVFAFTRASGLETARTSAMAALGASLLAQAGLRAGGRIMSAALAASVAVMLAMLYLPSLSALLATTRLSPGQWLAPLAAAAASAALNALLWREAPSSTRRSP